MVVVSSLLRAGSGGIPAASFDSRPALWQQGAASGSPQEGTLKCSQAYPPPCHACGRRPVGLHWGSDC